MTEEFRSLKHYIANKSVFTKKQIVQALGNERSDQTLANLLHYHSTKGNILKIKHGLYARVPAGIRSEAFRLDPLLVASQLADDAIIGYHSALHYWGNLHSMRNEIVYLTHRKIYPTTFDFQDITYRALAFPKKLVDSGKSLFEVQAVDRQGQKISITSLERTFVDVLDRPYLLGNDWEEIDRSLESIPFLDLEAVLAYVILLGNLVTAARVGFFLENYKEKWFVEPKHLEEFQKHLPRSVFYLDKKSKSKQRLIKKWKLMVPEDIINKSWEEPNESI